MRGISSKEANPFLGNRSIRYLLSHRDVFRTQIRAILRASAYGKILMLYPMVSCVEELRECAVAVAEVKASLEREGIRPGDDVRVEVALRDRVGHVYELKERR